LDVSETMFQDVLFLTELECFVIDFQVLLLLTKTIKKNLKLKKAIKQILDEKLCIS